MSPAALPNGSQAVAYSQTVTASGGTGPYTFVVTAGALPTGLSLSSQGYLFGTPTQSGNFQFTVVATSTAVVGATDELSAGQLSEFNLTYPGPSIPTINFPTYTCSNGTISAPSGPADGSVTVQSLHKH